MKHGGSFPPPPKKKWWESYKNAEILTENMLVFLETISIINNYRPVSCLSACPHITRDSELGGQQCPLSLQFNESGQKIQQKNSSVGP